MLTTEPILRKAMNSYYCDWCGELIPAKSHYMRWQSRDDSDPTDDGSRYRGWSTNRMHEECFGAFENLEHGSFRPQTHPRPKVDDPQEGQS